MGQKKTILIVDDEVNLATLVKHQLESNGYCVITANDGKEGLLKLRSVTPDLIILDVNMPNMNGLQFYKEIMTEHARSKFPVLILTTRSNLEETFRDIEVAGFMPKPFIMDKLVSEVARITSGAPKETVFILDFDHDPHIDYIEEVLFKENYEILNIISMDKLQERAVHKLPRYIIMKYKQGILNADEIINKIKADEKLKNIPIIVYSFSGDGAEEEQALNSGATKFLNKPENYEVIMKAIKEIEIKH